jgi:hypothetical protein
MAGRSEDQTMQYADKWFDLTLFVLGPLQGRSNDFLLGTDDRYILQMYLVFNMFYFYSGVGRAHLPPPPLLRPWSFTQSTPFQLKGETYLLHSIDGDVYLHVRSFF